MGKVAKALSKALPVDDANSHSSDRLDDVAKDDNLNQTHPVQYEDNAVQRQTAPKQSLNWDERLLDATKLSSPIAESLKKLRNKILHPPEGSPPKSILLTSVAPEEGKSFVCANLGIALARGLEQHAIMVDCDLRRPSLASLFGLPDNNKGLVDHLLDGVDLSLLIKQAGIQKLSLLPAGQPPPNPAELLDSARMVEMIEEIVSRYHDRYVLLDSPPFLAAAETAVLARHVDGVVLVIRWGGPRRENVKQLIDTIGREKIVGVIFNAYYMNELEKKLQKRGYYGYYTGDYYGKKEKQ